MSVLNNWIGAGVSYGDDELYQCIFNITDVNSRDQIYYCMRAKYETLCVDKNYVTGFCFERIYMYV